MADLSIFKLDNQTITIKDTTARQTAESAKTLATAAATAGNAVREQITELKSATNHVNNVDLSTADARPVYIIDSGNYEYGNGNGVFFTYFFPVNKGDVVTLLTTYQWGSYYALLRNDDVTIGSVPPYTDPQTPITLMTKDVPVTFTVPDDCSYVALRIDNQNISLFSVTIETAIWTYADQINSRIADVANTLPLNIKYRGLLFGFNDSEHKLRVFGSNNFNYFEQIGIPYLPTKGHQSCRDPYMYIHDGAYYVFYTDGRNWRDANNSIGIVKTYDFETYEEFDPIVCNENFVICWAPSIFEENGNYYLTVTASTTSSSQPAIYVYDFDFDTLTISNERTVTVTDLISPLDMQFYKFNGMYYVVGKNEGASSSLVAQSATLEGPYTILGQSQYSGHPEEGQTILRLDNGQYRMYVNDFYDDLKICYVDIPDITQPLQNVGTVHDIVSDSPVILYHVYVYDFNRAYSFES